MDNLNFVSYHNVFIIIGAIVRYSEGEPWSVLVIMPVVKQAQELLLSREIVFLDSTSGCESTGSTFTVIVTETKASIPSLCPPQLLEQHFHLYTTLK